MRLDYVMEKRRNGELFFSLNQANEQCYMHAYTHADKELKSPNSNTLMQLKRKRRNGEVTDEATIHRRVSLICMGLLILVIDGLSPYNGPY